MQEQSSRLLKGILAILSLVGLGAVAFIFISNGHLRDEKAPVIIPSVTTKQPEGTIPPEAKLTPTTPAHETIPMEEAQKQIKAIQDQANAGTISAEEAQKQIDARIARMAPPPLPPDAKK